MVECARLEIVLRRNTYGGSNPLLCAKNNVVFCRKTKYDISFNCVCISNMIVAVLQEYKYEFHFLILVNP